MTLNFYSIILILAISTLFIFADAIPEWSASKLKQEMKGKGSFVMFYTSSSYRADLERELEKVDGDDADVLLAKFNCSTDEKICLALRINKYPAFYYFYKNQYYEMQGDYTESHMQSFIEGGWTEGIEEDHIIPDLEVIPSKVLSLNLTNATFLHTSQDKIVIKFMAPWCGHCKRYAPIFESLARENPDIIFAKVNCDAIRILCHPFDIHGYPTLKLIEKGYVYDIPSRDKSSLLNFVRKDHSKDENRMKLPSFHVISLLYMEAVRMLKMLLQDFQEIKRNKTGKLSAIFGGAFLVGLALNIFIFILCCGSSRKKVVKEEKKEQ